MLAISHLDLFLPLATLTLLIIVGIPFFIFKRLKNREKLPIYQAFYFFGILFCVAGLILSFPPGLLGEFKENDSSIQIKVAVIGFLGVIISGTIALSASSFLGNAFAGLMLRTIRKFRTNDFIRINNFYGAVTERNLFHVEIQTEKRGLVTLPNLYVITNPIEVFPRENRIISAEVELRYDISRNLAAAYLKEAARLAELERPYVYILSLNGQSISYQINGFLPEDKSKLALTYRSSLHAMILDVFQQHRIQVVTPDIATQIDPGEKVFIPPQVKLPKQLSNSTYIPEEMIFEKAIKAENREDLKERLEQLNHLVKLAEQNLSRAKDAERKRNAQQRLEKLKKLQQDLVLKIEASEDL